MIAMRWTTVILMLLLHTTAFAQQLSVESFKRIDNDMDARIYAQNDQNGHKTALIKVVIGMEGFDFDVGIMGVTYILVQTGEIWVYVPAGVKRLTIRHPRYGVIRNYVFPVAIEEATVYELRLRLPAQPATDSPTVQKPSEQQKHEGDEANKANEDKAVRQPADTVATDVATTDSLVTAVKTEQADRPRKERRQKGKLKVGMVAAAHYDPIGSAFDAEAGVTIGSNVVAAGLTTLTSNIAIELTDSDTEAAMGTLRYSYIAAAVSYGYRIELGRRWSVTPSVSIDHGWLTENRNNSAAAKCSSAERSAERARVGAAVEFNIASGLALCIEPAYGLTLREGEQYKTVRSLWPKLDRQSGAAIRCGVITYF